MAAYFGGFPDFQPFGYGQRFDAERVCLLNIQVVITGGDKHKGGHDVAAHDDFIHYILHIHYYGDGFFDNNNHLIVSFSGGDNNTDAYYPTCLLVFGLDGEYIKTLEVGCKINSMRYDNKTNRLYMSLNDEIQFAYLNLDGLIK